MEESGEIVQACSKILRFGFFSFHPDDVTQTSNVTNLAREIGNLLSIVDALDAWKLLDLDQVKIGFDKKKETLVKYGNINK